MPTQCSEAVTACGRAFSKNDLETIRRIIASGSAPTRSAIARRTCEILGWRTPAGRLKEMSCRVAFLRLADRGPLLLPAPLRGNGNGERYRPTQEIVVPKRSMDARLCDLSGLILRPVRTRTDSSRWNEAVARFHYLGYNALPGAQQRYLVEHDGGLLGAIGFGASAWKVASRDDWIGWTPELPCTVVFEEYEWKALYVFVNKLRDAVPEEVPTLREVTRTLGRLGGHLDQNPTVSAPSLPAQSLNTRPTPEINRADRRFPLCSTPAAFRPGGTPEEP